MSRRPHPGVEPLEPRALLAADVAALTLLNAATDRPAGALADNATLDLAKLGRALAVRADLRPGAPAASVRFNYDGHPAAAAVDNTAPFTLPFAPTPGTHTLIVTPYAAPGAAGRPGQSRAITFHVVDTTPAPTALRVNAGGPAFTDAAAHAYLADTGFAGVSLKVATAALDIANTTDDALYRTARAGRAFTFTRAVAPGTYTLTLRFAEPGLLAPGRRTFDVSAEGQPILTNYDIAAEVGPRAAVVKTFTVTVTDNRLDLAFRRGRGDAIVSAIELTPAGPPPAPVFPQTPAPFRVNAGGNAYTDFAGIAFDGDNGFTGGTKSLRLFRPTDDLGNPTDEAALFATHRFGRHFTFARTVANGHYTLWLEFAEPTLAQPGQRTFDVTAEGQLILDDLDLAATAGPRQQTARAFDVTIADHRLDLDFTGVVGDAIVSAVALVPTDVPPEAAPYELPRGPHTGGTALDAAINNLTDVTSRANLLSLGKALYLYSSNQKRGDYPPSFEALAADQDVPIDFFANPRSDTPIPRAALSHTERLAWIVAHNDYIYLGAGKKSSLSAGQPLAYEDPRRVAGPINVLFGDLHVDSLDRAAAAALIRFAPDLPVDPQSPPQDDPARLDPNVIFSEWNLQAIGQAAYLYATQDKGRFPADLGTLYGFPDITLDKFLNPRHAPAAPPAPLNPTPEQAADWINAQTDYVYLGAQKTNAAPLSTVLAYENPADLPGGINLLFADGRVEFREMRWAIETLRLNHAPGFA